MQCYEIQISFENVIFSDFLLEAVILEEDSQSDFFQKIRKQCASTASNFFFKKAFPASLFSTPKTFHKMAIKDQKGNDLETNVLSYKKASKKMAFSWNIWTAFTPPT